MNGAGTLFTHRYMREVVGQFPTGVTVVSACGDGVIHAMTSNSFVSVSLEPPLVLVCVSANSRMNQVLDASGSFGVSVLRADQSAVAKHFASRSRPFGAEGFKGVDYYPGHWTEAPLLAGAIAWLECSIHEIRSAGDHFIYIGRVLALSQRRGDPLAFHGGAFDQLTGQRAVAG